MKINEDVWQFYQKHLGYTNDEMKQFRQNPRNEDVISKAPALMNKTIVVEVMEAHGCNSRHKAGDKFYFDGSGNLLTKLCPSRICFGAMSAMPALISMAHELFYAGVDPNEMRFKRVGCIDIGIQCGGWGRVIMDIKVEDRKKADK
jgi:uncharacterized repeat protein (TIGR04076 family)